MREQVQSHDGAWAEANKENDRHIDRIAELEREAAGWQRRFHQLQRDYEHLQMEREALGQPGKEKG